MNYAGTSPADHFSPISEAMLLSGHWVEADVGLAPPFMPRTLFPAYATSQNGPPDFRFHPTGSSLAVEGSPSFLSAAQTLYLPTCSSTWNSLSSHIGPMSFPIPNLSEFSAHGAQQTSSDDVVVDGTQTMPIHERGNKMRHIFSNTVVSALTDGQAIPASSHPEHVVLWHLMHKDAVIVNGPRKFVPQTIYQPHSQGDRERYVSFATLQPPVIFIAQDSPEWGIPIPHLLSKQSTRLVEGNEPAFTSCGPSIGIRVQWPGYQPCHKQVPTRDYTAERHMINKAKLAKVVARCVKHFIDTMSKQAMQVGSDTRWRVGPFDINADDIILVSLHHVSQGSWQPQLRLRRIIGANVIAGP